MNKLEQFIQSKPCGFLRDADIPELIKLDRLCQVLVRCGGCRFTCAAQDVAHLEQCIKAGGDYVRDVSFPVGSIERAASWRPETPFFQREAQAGTLRGAVLSNPTAAVRSLGALETIRIGCQFNENDCGGVFDGNTVTSDADPGL